ncbi:hypothetical protein MSKU15_1267 [Komagataeibacter diospyri]|nr:hypothetical protein [Komagataeibacter diospyri]GCE89666.1 hypothetical protein MSKU15_1267 [Komagataeibacter diospyri]
MIDVIHALSAVPVIRFYDLFILAGWIAAQPMLCVAAWRTR